MGLAGKSGAKGEEFERRVRKRGTWARPGGQGHQWPSKASGIAAGLTVSDGEFGPTDGLQHLPSVSLCGQLDSAEVPTLVLPPQLRDLEGAIPPAPCPVQGEPILKILMDETRAQVVDELPMKIFPSPKYVHIGIPG